MFRYAPRTLTLSPLYISRTSTVTRRIRITTTITATATRHFHQLTATFVNHDNDKKGTLISAKVPIIIGDLEESYVLVYPEVGRALCSGENDNDTSPASVSGDRCKLIFFHEGQYFGSGSSSYPRLYIPRNMPRQTPDSDQSPATLFLTGKMHEIVLDGTFDARFAEHASATGRDLGDVLDQLKDM